MQVPGAWRNLADAHGSGPCGLTPVEVQILSPPPLIGPAQPTGYRATRMGVIEVEGLRKEYRRLRGGRTTAVDGLDLDVPEGGVFGFLGPNGAGKTTTIRCLLGLVRPSGGRTRLMGADVPRSLAGVIGSVGSIVEQPALFPRFSGRRNLQILGRVGGHDDAADRTGAVPGWASPTAARTRSGRIRSG